MQSKFQNRVVFSKGQVKFILELLSEYLIAFLLFLLSLSWISWIRVLVSPRASLEDVEK
jgi:hypothetical protein